LRNTFDVEDNAYETLIFTYIKELSFLVSTSNITRRDVEEENSPPYLEDAMMDSKRRQ